MKKSHNQSNNYQQQQSFNSNNQNNDQNESHNYEDQSNNQAISNNSQNFNSLYLSQQSSFTNQPLVSRLPDITNFDTRSMDQNMIVSLFQVVQQQTIALQSLMKKVQYMGKKAQELNKKINILKTNQQLKQLSNFRVSNGLSGIDEAANLKLCKKQENQNNQNSKIKQNNREKARQNGANQIVDPQKLIQILFGSNNQYQFKLQLIDPLQVPLFRERNFQIKIRLIDNEGNQLQNFNKIPLNLAIYTCENPPKFIETNTGGNKMIKGFTQQTLQNGFCRFEKIQIRQVTSHFRNGWVFIIVIPSMTPLGAVSSSCQLTIDYKKIKPLVLQKIVVKAKKLKGKEKQGKKEFEQKGKTKHHKQQIKQEQNESESEQEWMQSESGYKQKNNKKVGQKGQFIINIKKQAQKFYESDQFDE